MFCIERGIHVQDSAPEDSNIPRRIKIPYGKHPAWRGSADDPAGLEGDGRGRIDYAHGLAGGSFYLRLKEREMGTSQDSTASTRPSPTFSIIRTPEA